MVTRCQNGWQWDPNSGILFCRDKDHKLKSLAMRGDGQARIESYKLEARTEWRVLRSVPIPNRSY